MGSEVDRVADLLADLYQAGDLSAEANDALLGTAVAIREIGLGLGERANSREVLLATILVDDSASVERYLHQLRTGHQLMLDTLARQSDRAEVLVLTRLFNRGVLYPYQEVASARSLNAETYNAYLLGSNTPLYEQSLLTLATTMAKAKEETDRGVDVRTVTLIITDGEDRPPAGRTTPVTAVRAIVTDMLEFATAHIVAAMGVGAGEWQRVFRDMGIPKEWIFDANATADELERIFERISARLAIAAASKTGFLELTSGRFPDA